MKDTVSTAAVVGQYKIGQVMYPGMPTPPTHPSTANHQQPPTHVAMAARPHPRRRFCPRTPRLPPPRPPPSIQTPQDHPKRSTLSHTDTPDRRTVAYAPPLNVIRAATTRTRTGKGGGGGADASGSTHPCASDGWPKHVGAAHPSSQPPHRTHPYAAPPQRPMQTRAKPPTQIRPPERRIPTDHRQSARILTGEPICTTVVVQPAERLEPGRHTHQPPPLRLLHHHQPRP